MPITAMQYPDLLKQNFGASRVAAIQEQYPLSDYPTSQLCIYPGHE